MFIHRGRPSQTRMVLDSGSVARPGSMVKSLNKSGYIADYQIGSM